MDVMMKKAFRYTDEATGRVRTVPTGWSGSLPDEVAEEAVAGGFASGSSPKKAKAADKGDAKAKAKAADKD